MSEGVGVEQTPDIETLAARLFLADPDRVEPGPWLSMAEVHQRPYRVMAQAASDVFAPVLDAAVREARAAAWDEGYERRAAELSMHIRNYLTEYTDISTPGLHATALTHGLLAARTFTPTDTESESA
jgi:hypothetical protein